MEPSAGDQIALHPRRILFPGRLPGTWSEPGVIALTNQSAARIAIQSIEITGPHGSDFCAEDLSGMKLFPGNACSVGVRFNPSGTGWRTAELLLYGAGRKLLWRVALVGYGASLELVGDCSDLAVRRRDIAQVALVTEGHCADPLVICRKAELVPGTDCERTLHQELLVAVPIAVQVEARCEENHEPVTAVLRTVGVQAIQVSVPLSFDASACRPGRLAQPQRKAQRCRFHILQHLQVEVPVTVGAEVLCRLGAGCAGR